MVEPSRFVFVDTKIAIFLTNIAKSSCLRFLPFLGQKKWLQHLSDCPCGIASQRPQAQFFYRKMVEPNWFVFVDRILFVDVGR
jgi:hypothetical protein